MWNYTFKLPSVTRLHGYYRQAMLLISPSRVLITTYQLYFNRLRLNCVLPIDYQMQTGGKTSIMLLANDFVHIWKCCHSRARTAECSTLIHSHTNCDKLIDIIEAMKRKTLLEGNSSSVSRKNQQSWSASSLFVCNSCGRLVWQKDRGW